MAHRGLKVKVILLLQGLWLGFGLGVGTYLLNRMTFYKSVCHEHSLQEVEEQGRKSLEGQGGHDNNSNALTLVA